ncbi:C-GCAxxG-C-C family protein [Geomesophilobacter sediminis]|uniref:C_GCAxxG_C_C family protein n=1 Tax=Geomesophilobacter sediminis TaxID=2798584 RepID=A0A8J7JB44_9BACT|nr:C-GCAxxG-C-C family protein [Geomesophilobacter sediminis]MBJ6723728.1 C_GCAxxG_C_C family protein [Geomesophilobacter sediminis]
MFWMKKEATVEVEGVADKVAADAEGKYRSGKMHCAEAVLSAVKTAFAPQVPEEVVLLAGGFGGGSGAGCLCGAVAGGSMAFGVVMNGDRKGAAVLTKDLHHWFKTQYRATCCKVITANGKGGCADLTGRVAGKVAELLLEKGCPATGITK